MEFRFFKNYEAEGIMLAHRLVIPGLALPAGHVLNKADISAMRSAGIPGIHGTKLQANDIAQPTATTVLSAAIAGQNTAYRTDSPGQVHIYAAANGLFVYDRKRLDRFNTEEDTVTASCLPPNCPVSRGQMVATLTVAGHAVNERSLQQCLLHLSGTGAMFSVAPYKVKKVALVQTRLPDDSEQALQMGRLVTQARVESLQGEVISHSFCPHEAEQCEQAIRSALGSGAELVLVAPASPTINTNDVVCEALKEALCDIVCFGLPVDPGTASLIATRKNKTPIYVLPAAYDKTDYNGIDLVLRQLMCALPVTKHSFIEMGAGGLIRRDSKTVINLDNGHDLLFGSATDGEDKNVAIVVLAAGSGQRFGSDNKLLNECRPDVPVLLQTVDNALASTAAPVIVVTGYEAEKTEALLDKKDVRIIRNTGHRYGVKSSIRLALDTLPKSITGAILLPGDMPGVSPDHLDQLIENYSRENKNTLCITSWQGLRFNPTLWDRKHFEDAALVPEDSHSRPVFLRLTDYMFDVKTDDEACVADINTMGDLTRFVTGMARRKLKAKKAAQAATVDAQTKTRKAKDEPQTQEETDTPPDVIYL